MNTAKFQVRSIVLTPSSTGLWSDPHLRQVSRSYVDVEGGHRPDMTSLVLLANRLQSMSLPELEAARFAMEIINDDHGPALWLVSGREEADMLCGLGVSPSRIYPVGQITCGPEDEHPRGFLDIKFRKKDLASPRPNWFRRLLDRAACLTKVYDWMKNR